MVEQSIIDIFETSLNKIHQFVDQLFSEDKKSSQSTSEMQTCGECYQTAKATSQVAENAEEFIVASKEPDINFHFRPHYYGSNVNLSTQLKEELREKR